MRFAFISPVALSIAFVGCSSLRVASDSETSKPTMLSYEGESPVLSSKKHRVTYDMPFDCCPQLTVTVPRGKLTIHEQSPDGFVFQVDSPIPGDIIKWRVNGPFSRFSEIHTQLVLVSDSQEACEWFIYFLLRLPAHGAPSRRNYFNPRPDQ
jgi:hypothetical protein